MFKIKVFDFKFSINEDKINNFIKDKDVIQISSSRSDYVKNFGGIESNITVVILYKENIEKEKLR